VICSVKTVIHNCINTENYNGTLAKWAAKCFKKHNSTIRKISDKYQVTLLLSLCLFFKMIVCIGSFMQNLEQFDYCSRTGLISIDEVEKQEKATRSRRCRFTKFSERGVRPCTEKSHTWVVSNDIRLLHI